MRKAVRWTTARPFPLVSERPACITSLCRRWHPLSLYQPQRWSFGTIPNIRTVGARPFTAGCRFQEDEEASKFNVHSRDPLDERHERMQQWAAQFDRLLPQSLGGQRPDSDCRPGVRSPADFDLAAFYDTLRDGRRNTIDPSPEHDVLAWMINNGHRSAAIWLIRSAQHAIAAQTGRLHKRAPSNIIWSGSLFDDLDRGPIEAASIPPDHQDSFPLDCSHLYSTHYPGRAVSQNALEVEQSIWRTVATLVLDSANADGPSSKQTMSAALLVIGNFHNLGLMPDRVYDSRVSPYSTYLKRPPILHMLSSRILAALSDAAWREQQDEAIASSLRMGKSLKEIGESAPGGRFRLKVRPLGPEIWLELILSACVELGHYRLASQLVYRLGNRTPEAPWFAIRWCSHQQKEELDMRIDWDRMKRRPGGTVGRIEGYSADKPFIDVPARTISVEVVLALVDALIDHVKLDGEKTFSGFMTWIRRIISFLEPHDLPASYFDYIQTRLMHSGAFSALQRPRDLEKWCSLLDEMRQLERLGDNENTDQDLSIAAIQRHSLLPVSLQHQAMLCLIQSGHIHNVLPLFNVIQEYVDRSKFESIKHFVASVPSSTEGFFSSRSFNYRLEYTGSHGQLSYHILAAFLDLISRNNLIGLGQWLLYSDDLDGPLIPESAYGLSSMNAALLRFVAVSHDDLLHTKLLSIAARSRLMPTVRLLRTRFDTELGLLDFSRARVPLLRLRHAQGGGVGLSNVATLAATILRLEAGKVGTQEERPLLLSHAGALMRQVLRGDYDCIRSDFTRMQKMLFRQQITHMARIFAYLEDSSLNLLARQYSWRFTGGNTLSLPPHIFNVILAAITETRGSAAGRAIWHIFCSDPTEHQEDDRDGVWLHRPTVDAPDDRVDSSSRLETECGDYEYEYAVPAPDTDVTFARNIEFLPLVGTLSGQSPAGGIGRNKPDKKDPESDIESSARRSLQLNGAAMETQGTWSHEDEQIKSHALIDVGLVQDWPSTSDGRAQGLKQAIANQDPDEDSEFIDPFFATPPMREENISRQSARERFDRDMYQHDWSEPEHQKHRIDRQELEAVEQRHSADNAAAALLEPTPVTQPDLQTLRIIVRQVVHERELRETRPTKRARRQYNAIIRWAFENFRALGIDDQTILEQEIQQPLTELEIDSSDHIDRPTEGFKVHRVQASRRRHTYSTRRAGNSVSRLWIPQGKWVDLRAAGQAATERRILQSQKYVTNRLERR